MTTATLTERDVRLRDAVQQQLEWDSKWTRAPLVSPPEEERSRSPASSTATPANWQPSAVERAAADGPGIRGVVNRLAVEPAEPDDAYELC